MSRAGTIEPDTSSADVAHQSPDAAAVAQAPPDPRAQISSTSRLETFIHLCQSGSSVSTALKSSGLLADAAQTPYYDPALDDELTLEELLFKRLQSKKAPVLSDEAFSELPIDQKIEANKRGELSRGQIFKIVDWLVFTRALPLRSIATMLNIPPADVVTIKAEISNDFAKTIRSQNAESYIGDLLRVKELIKSDLMMRKSKLHVADARHITLDKVIWEIENKFIDRLQDIGIISKTLGKLEVHEEWTVTIGAAGQPVNAKLEQLPDRLSIDAGDGDIIDVETSESSELAGSAPIPSAVINVGERDTVLK